MKRLFRGAEPKPREELERAAADELRAASGLPQAAGPVPDHPAAHEAAQVDEPQDTGVGDETELEPAPLRRRRRRKVDHAT